MLYLADFLKTNLTTFAVISVKKRQKARFVSPRSPTIVVTKEKETRKKKSEEKKKSNGLVFVIASLEIVFGQKNCWTQKVYLAMTLSKIRLDIWCHKFKKVQGSIRAQPLKS